MNVSIACGICISRVECVQARFFYPSSLVARALAIACGMCPLLVECAHCLWNVYIASGMCPRMIFESLLIGGLCSGDCLWNVSIAYGMCLLHLERVQA